MPRSADLRPADLRPIDLRPADLRAADLRPADLRPALPGTRADEGRGTSDATSRTTSAATLAAALASASSQWLHLVELRAPDRWTSLLPAEAASALHPSLHAELSEAQAWLLSWLPGQGTDLHDHGGSSGAFAVVRGALTERVVADRRSRPLRESVSDLPAGRVRRFGPHHVHEVRNTGLEPAVSVHVYVPGLTEMRTYAVEDRRLVVTGTGRAGADW